MDSIFEITLLMDFYGQLITKRQYMILDLHYNNDYSFGEIAELLSISRQGVYDNIKKGKVLLNNFENKLGLVKKFLEQRTKIENTLKELSSINIENVQPADRQKLKNIEKALKEIMEVN
ncbi:MAG: YlxM family DNA-binding protein [Acetivibrionales bacterium]|jgi:predicted DNA-binding protein YlxM (UPF0122 family)